MDQQSKTRSCHLDRIIIDLIEIIMLAIPDSQRFGSADLDAACIQIAS